MFELYGAFSGTSVVTAFKNTSPEVRKEALCTSEPANLLKVKKENIAVW